MARPGNVLRIAGMALVAALLLVPGLLASHPTPLTEGPQFYSLGLEALDRWLAHNNLYADNELLDRFFVEDQMMAVMVKLRAAAIQPDQRARLQSEALALWSQSQTSYDTTDQFYHTVIPPPSGARCINIETEAWGLRAARGLVAANQGDLDLLGKRIQDARSALLNLLETQTHEGRGQCLSGANQLPIAVIALLELRGNAPDPRIDQVTTQVMNSLIGQFRHDALPSLDDFYLVELNAKLLWMLTDGAQALPSAALVGARDRLLGFLINETVEPTSSGQSVFHVRRQGTSFTQARDPNALNQLWLAHALSHYNQYVPGRVPSGLVAGILRTLLADFWSKDRGAFVNPSELISFDHNALVGLFSNGPILQSLATETSELALAIPDTPSHTYREADPFQLMSQWHLRFQLSGDRAGTIEILLPSGDLGSYNFTASGTGLRLYRSPTGGARVPIDNYRIEPGPIQALRFSTELSTAASGYRLEGGTPLRALTSHFENRIQINLDNPGNDDFGLRTLRLEISATDIDVRAVKMNGEVIARDRYEVVSPVTTQEVQQPHTRLIVNDLIFQPGRSELVIEYDDREAPQIGPATISHDAEGRDVVRASPSGTALQGETLYVRAVVGDNAVLRNVLLRYQSQTDPREVIEKEMQEGDQGIYTAQIPNTNKTGTARVQVIAIDGASNLAQSDALFVEIKNPLLSGSRVLFAFSGTLFLSAFIIWAKVRRKPI